MAEPTRLMAPARQPNAWELGTLRWDVFYAVVFVAILLFVESDQLSAASRTAATIALVAMVPWYVVVGRPVMRSGKASWQGPAYLAGLIALFAVAVSQDTNAWALAFAICPQCFYVLPFRQAMIPVVILNVLGALLLVYRQPHLDGAVAAIGIAAFGIGFSYAYGSFVDRIIDQSNERAELIAELEATRAELAAANHESGKLAERQRLAGEIHDTLAQGFSSIIMLLQAAEAGLAGAGPAGARPAGTGLAGAGPAGTGPTGAGPADAGPAGAGPADAGPAGARPAGAGPAGERTGGTGPAGPGLASARRQLRLAAQTARENLADARALIDALSAAGLASETLPGALRRVTERAGTETGIGVSFDVSGTPRPLSAAFDVALLRVGQEALANVRKHAGAGSVQVLLSYQPAAVSLEVTDDGQGFDPAQVNGGYGLRGMRDRLGQAGGRVQIRSAPGAGTSVRAEVPA